MGRDTIGAEPREEAWHRRQHRKRSQARKVLSAFSSVLVGHHGSAVPRSIDQWLHGGMPLVRNGRIVLGPWGCSKCGQDNNHCTWSSCKGCQAATPKKYLNTQKQLAAFKHRPQTFRPRQASTAWAQGPSRSGTWITKEVSMRQEIEAMQAKIKQLQTGPDARCGEGCRLGM